MTTPSPPSQPPVPGNWREALASLGLRTPLIALIVIAASTGAAGWWLHEFQHRAHVAAMVAQLSAAEARASQFNNESARTRQELAEASMRLKDAVAAREQVQSALRQTTGGDMTAAARQRAEAAEQAVRDAVLARDRFEQALQAKEAERAQWQRAKEAVDQRPGSFQSVAVGTLPQCSLRTELVKLEQEKKLLLERANDLSRPSSDLSSETREIQREQIFSEVVFKRQLIDGIVQKCK